MAQAHCQEILSGLWLFQTCRWENCYKLWGRKSIWRLTLASRRRGSLLVSAVSFHRRFPAYIPAWWHLQDLMVEPRSAVPGTREEVPSTLLPTTGSTVLPWKPEMLCPSLSGQQQSFKPRVVTGPCGLSTSTHGFMGSWVQVQFVCEHLCLLSSGRCSSSNTRSSAAPGTVCT